MAQTRNDILIQIRADLRDITSKLSSLQGISKDAADKVSGTWDGVTGQFSKLGLALEGVQRIFQGFSSAIQPILTFEQRLAEINTIARLTPDALQGIGDKLTELSRTIPVTADDLAKGLYEVLSAGITDTGQALGVLEDSARLAVAGLADTRATVDAVTTVLNSYSLAASESGRVTDLFFGAVERGKTTMEQLAPTIGRVTPIAATLGLQLEDLFGAIATLTAGGLKTDQAITGISSLLRSITNVSTEGQQLAAKLGIAWDSTTIKTNGLVGTMKLLRDATGGNAEQMRMLIQDSEGYITALALTGDRMQQLERDTLAMADTAGATGKAFETMADTGQNSAVILGNAWAETIRTLDELVLPTLVSLRDNIEAIKIAGKDLLIAMGLLAAGLAVVFAGPVIAAVGFAVTTFAGAVAGASGAVGFLVTSLAAGAGLLGAVRLVMSLFADDTERAESAVAGLNTVLQLAPEKAADTYKKVAGSAFNMTENLKAAGTAAKDTTATVAEESEKQFRALDTLNNRIVDRQRAHYEALARMREDHDLLMGRLQLEFRQESAAVDQQILDRNAAFVAQAMANSEASWDTYTAKVQEVAGVLESTFDQLGQGMQAVFEGQKDAMRNLLKGALIVVLDYMKKIIEAASLKALADAILLFNPGVIAKNLAILTSIEAAFAGLRAGVTAFATGGLVTSPTLALVGEAGAEYIGPKRKFEDELRNEYKRGVMEGDKRSHTLLEGVRSELANVSAILLNQPRAIGRETGRALGTIAREAV